MLTKRIAPPKHLEQYIRFFWTLEFTDLSSHDSLFKVFARKYPRMVFQHSNGNSGIYHGEDYLPLAYLSGLNTRPYDCGIHPSISAIGVSFYPHALRPIFGMNVSGIVNELPDISNFVNTCLVNRLLDARSTDQKVQILSDFFSRQLRRSSGEEIVYERGWKMLMNGTDENQVQHLTRVFNLSERQLERRFKENLGLSPKQYLRINRFERSLSLLHACNSSSLRDISYELGYSDQSHFIREFRQFSGNTPGAYINADKLYDERSAFILKHHDLSGQARPELPVYR
jgi:AraC-like DNA-binding protein